MNKETFKTLLLGVLVFASVSMTTNIWFYKTDYENYKGPSESLKSVAIADSKNLTDVVRPTLALTQEDGQIFGQTGNTSVAKVYHLIQRASFINVFPAYGQKSVPERSNQASMRFYFRHL
ncbi:two-component system activity regulator YycH [Terrilactibacillus sp. S3-3]|nr:two-component system activity regulator YycH [Terrilactibacillus sp. S3-3]